MNRQSEFIQQPIPDLPLPSEILFTDNKPSFINLDNNKSKINNDFGKTQEDFDEEIQQKPLTQGHWKISIILFYEIFKYMKKIKKEFLDKGQILKFHQLPPLAQDQKIEQQSDRCQKLLKHYQQNNIKLTQWKLFQIFFGGNRKKDVCIIVFLLQIFALTKVYISVLLATIIDSIQQGDSIETIYGYSIFLLIINLITILTFHIFYAVAYEFSNLTRMSIANLIYHKMMELSANQIKNKNMAKIISMISVDLNIIEPFFIYMFFLFTLPLTFIACCILLWVRFNGPIGFILLGCFFVLYPIQIIFQKLVSYQIKKTKLHSDHRINLTNEMIEGIRMIKMYAWEDAFTKFIKIIANKENRCYWKVQLIFMSFRALSFFGQVWVSVLFFYLLYHFDLVELTISKMTSTIQLAFFIVFFYFKLLFFGIDAILNLKILFQRMIEVIGVENISKNEEIIKIMPSTQDHLKFSNFSCKWNDKFDYTLKDINLQINCGQSIAIVGEVGSGKSTLLQCLLSQLPIQEGDILFGNNNFKDVQLQISYVEQEPHIFPGTILENIKFGKEFDIDLFEQVVHASNLQQDLDNFPDREDTQIGEKGINLSGGQKARISFARALYQKADLYLFDDPLSAVDANVARNIFRNGIQFFIKNNYGKKQIKPIVFLVTHQVQYALECDKVIYLKQGKVVAYDKPENLQNMLKINKQEDEYVNIVKENPVQIQKNKIISQLYKKEQSKQTVTLGIYAKYFKQWPSIILLVLLIVFNITSEVQYNLIYQVISQFDNYSDKSKFFLLLLLLCIGSYISNFLKYFFISYGTLETNEKTHNRMLEQLKVLPISFFDTNPSGRIINRFSNDKSFGDFQLIVTFYDIYELLCQFVVSIVFIIILEPIFLIIVVIVIFMQIYWFKYCYQIIVDSKENDSVQKSPMFDFFKNTLSGILQIQIYKQQSFFKTYFIQLSNNCIRSNLGFYYCSLCFGFVAHVQGYIAQVFGILVIIGLKYDSPHILAQGLLILLIFNDNQQWCLRQMILVHAIMSSTKRMYELIEEQPEPSHFLDIDKQIKKQKWPSQGQIRFNNVEMSYRKNTPLVLKKVTFNIEANQRIGFIGRTGAGKSSILQALFRICEIDSGKIEIDGVDISTLGLVTLRSSLALIPQSPFLFSGTVSRNVDPLGEYTQEQIELALQETNLYNFVNSLPQKLETENVDKIFSAGQKQLLCLARVILNKKKIIVLDEATANVDHQTDEFIQNAIRYKFKEATIITIAHRLNTIADYDQIIVMDKGQVSEQGTPNDLLSNPESLFSQMVKATGKANAKKIRQIIENSQKQ